MVHQAVHQAVRQAAQAAHQAPNRADILTSVDIRDLGFSARQCVDFARLRPDIARRNAENYAYFIVNRGGRD